MGIIGDHPNVIENFLYIQNSYIWRTFFVLFLHF